MKPGVEPRGRGVSRRAHRLSRRAHAARGRRRLRLLRRYLRRTASSSRSGCGVAGDALRPRLDDPRATRPSSAAGTARRCRRSSTSRSSRAAGIPRVGHFPGYAIVAPSLLEFGNDEQKAARARRDPRRHDLVHRHERAERRLRPRRPADPRRGATTTTSSSTARRSGRSYAMIAQKCFCYVRTDPDAAEAQGHLAAHHRHGHARHRHPAAAPHQRHRRASPRCSSPTSIVPRENLVGELNGGWAITQGSLAHERAGLWVEGVARLEQTIAGLVELAQRARPRPTTRSSAARSRARTSWRRACARSATRASPRSRRARRRPSTRYMKMATSESGQGRCSSSAWRSAGPFGAGHRPRASARTTAAGSHGFFMSFANTIAGGSSRDPAQHHRPARPRAPEEVRRDRWTSRSPTTRSCCATPARKLLDQRVPAGARARAHRRPVGVRAAVAPPAASTPRSAPARVADLCLFLEETGYVAAPGPFFADRARRTAARRDRHPATIVAANDGHRRVAGRRRWARTTSRQDFVLEADRVDRIAIVDARPVGRGRRRRRRAARASSRTVDFSRRAASSSTVAATSATRPLDRRRVARVARPRARRRSRPRWSAPRAASST